MKNIYITYHKKYKKIHFNFPEQLYKDIITVFTNNNVSFNGEEYSLVMKNGRLAFTQNCSDIDGLLPVNTEFIYLFFQEETSKTDNTLINYLVLIEKDDLRYDVMNLLLEVKGTYMKGAATRKVYFSSDDSELLEITKAVLLNKKLLLNEILYGPPGTGKTYSAIGKSIDIVHRPMFGLKDNPKKYFITRNFPNQSRKMNYAPNYLSKKIFSDANVNNQIVFTTFHQSLGYEDFIEGIKPATNNIGNVQYAVIDGIFKRVCNIALAYELKINSITKKERNSEEYISIDDVFKEIFNNKNEKNNEHYQCIKDIVDALLNKFKQLQLEDGNNSQECELKARINEVIDDNEFENGVKSILNEYLENYLSRNESLLKLCGITEDSVIEKLRDLSNNIENALNDISERLSQAEERLSQAVEKLSQAETDSEEPDNESIAELLDDLENKTREFNDLTNRKNELLKASVLMCSHEEENYRNLLIDIYEKHNDKQFINDKLTHIVMPSRVKKSKSVDYKYNIGSTEYIINMGNDNQKKNVVLIIDEFNRGNVSQIFGELITLIEEDKRYGAKNATSVTLPYSGESFIVPPNLYIIGTMNTADRSVEALDTALRRRFVFTEMKPDYSLLNNVIVEGINISDMLRKMNEEISKIKSSRDYEIGHAYFWPLKEDPSLDKLKSIFANSILPLLKEYFYGDYSSIKNILHEIDTNNDPVVLEVTNDFYDVQIENIYNKDANYFIRIYSET